MKEELRKGIENVRYMKKVRKNEGDKKCVDGCGKG